MATDEQFADAYLSKLKRALDETVLGFWHPRAVDDEHGGYLLGYDADGEFITL